MDLILEKILHQSQILGIRGIIEQSGIAQAEKISERMSEQYAWVEKLFEENFQMNKLIIAQNLKIMTQDEELNKLRSELLKLNKVLANEL